MVTFTYFILPPADWRRGLAQMATSPRYLAQVPGVRFARMLGCGIRFGLRPDLAHYGLLAEWTSAETARRFLTTDPLLASWTARGWDWHTHWLEPTMAHGAWDGVAAFQPLSRARLVEAAPEPVLAALAAETPEPAGPVAVLTRATIRWRRLAAFWRAVPATAQAALNAPGLRFSVGMGELPLVRQATLSIWESEEAMRAFAYQHPAHRQVIQRTRAEGWYQEELFARFRVVG